MVFQYRYKLYGASNTTSHGAYCICKSIREWKIAAEISGYFSETFFLNWAENIITKWTNSFNKCEWTGEWQNKKKPHRNSSIFHKYCIRVCHACYFRAEDGLRVFVCRRTQQFRNKKKLMLTLKTIKKKTRERKKKNAHIFACGINRCTVPLLIVFGP